MRPSEPPTLIEGSRDDETRYTHPAFGQMAVSRVRGSTRLYGSDFEHRACLRIRIAHSELCRSLSRDWHHERGEIIEVELSEAQWATFVSSPNTGGGEPCTIRHIDGKQMPRIEARDEKDNYAPEVKDRIDRASNAINALAAKLRNGALDGVSKARAKEILNHVETAQREFTANVPFVVKSFGEHVETRVEKAKTEIHGWMTSTIQRAGLQALAERDGAPLLLEAPVDREDER